MKPNHQREQEVSDCDLVAGSATPAAAANTLYVLFILQLRFGDSAHARGLEIGLLGLDTAKAT